jgi:hypothetical protein
MCVQSMGSTQGIVDEGDGRHCTVENHLGFRSIDGGEGSLGTGEEGDNVFIVLERIIL